ncbi:MAG: hypothetical protein LLG04_05335 [Parachlamydia sp.]|nr:hypothetical protein [Parachlamydia sp.]
MEKQWRGAPLGDKCLEKRAIKIGEACLHTPNGTLPKKFDSWGDTKGAYRFFDSDEVPHEAIQEVHNKNVVDMATASNRMVLFIQDGSELIYNKHPSTNGLGPTTDAYGQGIMFHTCLAVEWSKDASPITIGVAKQTPWIRPEHSEEETKDIDQKEKKSWVWLNTLKVIGRPPSNSRWVSVGDRGNEIYEYIVGAKDEGWNYGLRSKHDRSILVDGEKKRIHKWIRSLEPKGEYELDLRSRGKKFSRKVTLKIAWDQATMLPPTGKKGKEVAVIYVRAYDPEDEDLEWILVTSLEVNSVGYGLKTCWRERHGLKIVGIKYQQKKMCDI